MSCITSAQNPFVKHLLKLQKESSYRRSSNSILLEGKKLVLEAVEKLKIKHCITQDNIDIEGDFPKMHLADTLIQKISHLKNSEGYFAEVEYPLNASLEGLKKILVLDGVQNPGNMGTLIRTALAFDYEGIFILNASADPYSPKVLRASMGASLYIPICIGSEQELMNLSQTNQMDLFIADAAGPSVEKVSFHKPHMLVLGNESQGSFLKTKPKLKMVSLPIQNVDSLNVAVAGSLLMYLMRTPS